GALEARVVRGRRCEVVGSWHAPGGDWRPAELEAESLQLAVARGAAYFGLVRRGLGVRIGGGAARTYYLGLGGEPATALCIVPRGMEEGESVEIADRELELLAHRPAAAGDAALVVEPARLDEASALLRAAFESGDDPVTLTRRLEAALDAGRDAWPLAAIRTLWDALWPLEPARARSAEHEARWLNLAGFLRAPSSAACSWPRRNAGPRPSPSSGRSPGSARACRSTGRSTASSRATRRRRGRSASSPPSGRAPRPMPSPSPSSRARRATAGATS